MNVDPVRFAVPQKTAIFPTASKDEREEKVVRRMFVNVSGDVSRMSGCVSEVDAMSCMRQPSISTVFVLSEVAINGDDDRLYEVKLDCLIVSVTLSPTLISDADSMMMPALDECEGGESSVGSTSFSQLCRVSSDLEANRQPSNSLFERRESSGYDERPPSRTNLTLSSLSSGAEGCDRMMGDS